MGGDSQPLRAASAAFLLSAVKQVARQRAAVSLIFLAHGTIVGSWLSRIPAVRDRLHLSPAALGFALLGGAVGALLTMPLSARLCTAYGSRDVTRGMSLAFCASLLLPGLAADRWMLFPALVLYGAAGGGMDVAMNTQGAEVERRRGKPTMSSFHALFSIGGMLGSAAGALAAQRLPVIVHLAIAAAVLAVCVAVAGLWLPDAAYSETGTPFRLRALSGVLLGLSIISFCVLLGEGAMADWSAVYLADIRGTSAAVAALGYAVFSAMMAAGRLAGDTLTARFGAARTVRYGSLLAACGLFFALFIGGVAPAMIGFACAGAGFSSIFPNMCSAAAVQPHIRPEAAIAAVSVTGYFGFLAGPPAIGGLAQLAGLRIALMLVVMLSLIASLLASSAKTARI